MVDQWMGWCPRVEPPPGDVVVGRYISRMGPITWVGRVHPSGSVETAVCLTGDQSWFGNRFGWLFPLDGWRHPTPEELAAYQLSQGAP